MMAAPTSSSSSQSVQHAHDMSLPQVSTSQQHQQCTSPGRNRPVRLSVGSFHSITVGDNVSSDSCVARNTSSVATEIIVQNADSTLSSSSVAVAAAAVDSSGYFCGCEIDKLKTHILSFYMLAFGSVVYNGSSSSGSTANQQSTSPSRSYHRSSSSSSSSSHYLTNLASVAENLLDMTTMHETLPVNRMVDFRDDRAECGRITTIVDDYYHLENLHVCTVFFYNVNQQTFDCWCYRMVNKGVSSLPQDIQLQQQDVRRARRQQLIETLQSQDPQLRMAIEHPGLWFREDIRQIHQLQESLDIMWRRALQRCVPPPDTDRYNARELWPTVFYDIADYVEHNRRCMKMHLQMMQAVADSSRKKDSSEYCDIFFADE